MPLFLVRGTDFAVKDDEKSVEERAAEAFADLTKIIAKLRAPDGCPWDREQTHESLKPFIVEESYEVMDAIDRGKPADLKEELGDLLLQIMLQSEISREEGEFDIADVVTGLSGKMVNRHPHVFGNTPVDGADEVLVNWEKIKKEEKKGSGLFDGLPLHLPGLVKAARMGEKAGRVGFDWPKAVSVRDKVREELEELDEAVASGDRAAMEHELGDLLFSVAQWGRHLGQFPEEAIQACCTRFVNRFEGVEELVRDSGREIADCTLQELEDAWQEVKNR